MTRQEIFEKAYRGLASQGFERSMSADGRLCAYRSAVNNLRCALGHLIPDKKYRRLMEDEDRDYLMEELLGFPADSKFYEALQDAHDDSRGDMPERLAAVAQRFGLTVPAVQP